MPRELPRPRVTGLLAHRFSHRVTAVVAGAGFGKTTALAQAIRTNLVTPSGIDAWVSCETADEDEVRLAAAIVEALGQPNLGENPLQAVLRAARALAPIDVCLVLDDLHEIPVGSSGSQLIGQLVDQLPAHAHLVLASRVPLPYQLARLRAGAQVIDIEHTDLGFMPDETAELAALHDQPDVDTSDMGGWPSLIALALSTRQRATSEFLLEEVVGALDHEQQQLLLAMATLGWGSLDDVSFVTERPILPADLHHVVTTVPLVSAAETEGFLVHRLWEDAAMQLFHRAAVDRTRNRTLRLLRDRDEILRLGSAALRWNHESGIRDAALGLVRVSLGALPIETARRWIASVAPNVRAGPEFRLLDLAVAQALRNDSEGLDTDLDRLIEHFESRDEQHGSAEAIALAAVTAHGRGDLGRLFDMAQRSRSLEGAETVPLLRFLCGAIDASLTSLEGDAHRALEIIDELPFDQVPQQVSELVTRLRVTMFTLTGHPERALMHSYKLESSRDPHVRDTPRFVQWQAGDPTDSLTAPLGLGDVATMNARDRFMRAAFLASVSASTGDHETAGSVRVIISDYLAAHRDGRESAIGSTAIALCDVLNGDEGAAISVLGEHLERFPVPSPLAELHLRRNIAVTYALNPTLRAYWDHADLGPHQRTTRQVIRQLLDMRDGLPVQVTTSPGAIITMLPLPWSVEFAVRAHMCGDPTGRALLDELTHWRLTALRDELGRLSGHCDVSLAANAQSLLSALPTASRSPLDILVLGPMRLVSVGHDLDSPELRRSRVRTVLSLLVLRRSVTRDELIELIWPDADTDRARQNVRTTLSRLRRLLEPDAEESHGRLRTEGDTITLASPPAVDSDLWQLRAASGRDDMASRQACVDLWRGSPMPDLASIAELAPELERIRMTLVDSCLALGEQLLATGRLDDALVCVDRCREDAPLSERAQRLGLAIHLQRNDRDALANQVASLDALLRELEVDPEPATAMLLSRAATALGSAVPLDR